MLEKRIVPETAAFYGYLYVAGVTALKNGAVCKLSAVYANTEGPVDGGTQWAYPTMPTTGWSFTAMVHTDNALNGPNTWLIKKYEYAKDNADVANDVIYSGESVVAYNEGWFDTDQYQSTITNATSIGTNLYVSGGKWTSTATSGGTVRGKYWGIKSSYDTNYWNAAPIYVQVLSPAVSGA